jgi:hypothetical protein
MWELWCLLWSYRKKVRGKGVTTEQAHMPKTYGPFKERDPNAGEYLIIGFSPSSVPLRQRWRNNSLSADFLADYVTSFFPAEDDDSSYHRAEVKDAVSYIANELLENAMKFSADTSKFPVDISLYLHPDEVRFYVTNSTTVATTAALKEKIDDLLSGDIETMYFNQLEENAVAERDSPAGAGIGFLTILYNYNTHVAWRFHDVTDPSAQTVTVTVMISLDTTAPIKP